MAEYSSSQKDERQLMLDEIHKLKYQNELLRLEKEISTVQRQLDQSNISPSTPLRDEVAHTPRKLIYQTMPTGRPEAGPKHGGSATPATSLRPDRSVTHRRRLLPETPRMNTGAIMKKFPANEWVWELKERLETAHKLVRTNTEKAMKRQKKIHDTRTSYEKFDVGDKVTDGTKRAHKDTPTDGSQTSRPSRELPQDPRNRTSFYNRVDTYSPLTWFAKPLELSPLVCARYGWKNTDTDMLQCVACRAYVSGQLPKAVDAASYHESCEKLKANLVLSHEKLCTWFSSPSPESFMCLRFHNGEVDFRERLASLAQTTAALPSATYTSIDSQEVNKERVEKFCSRLQTQNGDGEKMTADGCLFALCGWSYCESQVDVLECSCCRRKVGLWNYSHVESSNTAESNGHSQPDADGPCRKRARIEKQDFDPVAEHRYWCPWLQKRSPPMVRALLEKSFVSEDRNVETNASQSSSPTARLLESPPDVKADLLQSPPGDNCESTNQEPAWLIVVKLLLGQQEVSSEEEEDLNLSRQMKMSPQLDGVHRLRRILKDCTSPSPTKVKIATSGSTD